jgi:hypothetical protein
MNRDSVITRNPQVVARELGGAEGAVLLHLESGAYHGLNPVGLLIWELVDGERTVADIIDAVRVQIADPPPQVDEDVVSFVESAVQRNLLIADS